MSEIIKSEAVVLSKLNYGESSSIVTLYTKERGKISVILKGGRSPKSKISLIVDPLNYLEVIIYSKLTREIQVLTGAEIRGHFHKIKEDLDKLKYAHSVIELIKSLTVEHEVNQKLFSGIVRILEVMEGGAEDPAVQFGRFFLFFLKESGYELQMNKCASCGKTNLKNQELSYSFENGILCSDCRRNYLEDYGINPNFSIISHV